MIELNEPSLRAPVPVFADERALTPIAPPDRALDVRRDVTRIRGRATAARARLVRRRKLAFLELRNERLERHPEHLGDVPRRQLVAQQVLCIAQVVVRLLIDRDLQRIALRR